MFELNCVTFAYSTIKYILVAVCACICIMPSEALGLIIQRPNIHFIPNNSIAKEPNVFPSQSLSLSYTLSLSPLLYWVIKACASRDCTACFEDWCWTFSSFKYVGGLDNIVPKELLATLPSLCKWVCCGRDTLAHNWPLFWLYSQTYQSKTQPKPSNYSFSFLIIFYCLSFFLSITVWMLL